jgi:hypothetical protein
MYKTLKELSFGTLCGLYVFGFSMLGMQAFFSRPMIAAEAQMSGSSSGGGSSSSGGSGNTSTQYTATLIGGTTGGVNDDEVCCNGIVLDFESNFPGNPLVLDGYALFVPFISKGWETDDNHYDENYNTLGTVRQGLCFLPDDYCESFETILEVVHVGTSPEEAGGSSGGSGGGVTGGGATGGLSI